MQDAFRLFGSKKFLALFVAATCAFPALAEEISDAAPTEVPEFQMPDFEGADLFRIALTDEGASKKDRVYAELAMLGLNRATILNHAIENSNQRVIDCFLAAGVNVKVAGEQGKTPLLVAASTHHWELVGQLLKTGANPRLADETGFTPLMAAADAGNVPVIEKLLAAGAPVDAVNNAGRLALSYAMMSKKTAAVETLLARHKSLPVVGRGGDDLAEVALQTGNRDLFEDVLRRLPGGLKWTQTARAEFSKALAAHDTILGPLFMAKYAGAPAASEHAQPLLAYAVASRNAAQVRTLLDLGADPNTALDQSTDTAFRERVGNNFMRYYLDSTQGLTVLMLAAGMKQADMVKLLLEYGASRNACTHGKSSLIALYFAAWADSPDTIQVLLGDAPSKDDVRIEVSLDEQRARYFRNGQLILSSEISTGRDGFATKPGDYVITDKHLEHHSTLYHNASMPYFMRLSCQAFGLHEGYVTGRPASHGCIRLPGEVARRLFKEAPVGTWVSIR